MKLHPGPNKARVLRQVESVARDAWFYENAKSIDVYVYMPPPIGKSVCVRLTRAQLADWLKRTTPGKWDAEK